jgi:hypothetical protein
VKLYFAAGEQHTQLLRSEGVTRVLMAYPFVVRQEANLQQFEGLDVFLDSGAWSVFSGSIPKIDVAQHTAFVKRTRHVWSVVAAVDVIGDADRSLANFEYAVNEGVDVMPTWHRGEPVELAHCYAARSRAVALGGLAGRGVRGDRDALTRAIGSVWSAVSGHDVHLFGVSHTPVIKRFRPYSVDSTGWLAGTVYGRVFTLRRPFLTQVPVTGIHLTDRRVGPYLSEFNTFGMTWRELSKSAEARLRYNMRVLLEFERRMSQEKAA